MGNAYILKAEAEPGLTYCENWEKLLGEIETVLQAYEHNNPEAELGDFLEDFKVAELVSNHGELRPASELGIIVHGTGGDGWEVIHIDDK